MVGYEIGNYKIISFLGKGSFSSVYKCINKNGEYFALKIFNLEYVFSESQKKKSRINKEIDSLKSVESDFVMKYFEHGSYMDGEIEYLFLVLEFIEGEPLTKYIEKNNLDFENKIRVFEEILNALNAIHKCNIIHRDLKPDNIMITNDGKIKLIDFGLSKIIDRTRITSTGNPIGSPIFMSPEQVKGSIEEIDFRSDFYSMGIILFFILTQEYPFKSLAIEDLYLKIIRELPKSVLLLDSTIPSNIDKLINKLLEKNNYDRPQSIDEIVNLLKNDKEIHEVSKNIFDSVFYLRLLDEKTLIGKMEAHNYNLKKAIFPIHLKKSQKGLLKFLQDKKCDFWFDPSTMRLAYDNFINTKGLVELPYAPLNGKEVTVNYLSNSKNRELYVEKAVRHQIELKSNYIVAPFHYSNNNTTQELRPFENESWFTLDIKIAKETKEFLKKNSLKYELIVGACIRISTLNNEEDTSFFINLVSSLPADYFWVYVDSIDYETSYENLIKYIKLLRLIQLKTNKKVVAGRIPGPVGLILSCFGIYGFEGGSSRFEKFSEDLLRPDGKTYNMYCNYYFPSLLKTIPINRRDPSKIKAITESDLDKKTLCDCGFCDELFKKYKISDSNSKSHFLLVREKELIELNAFKTIEERIKHMQKRIENAINLIENMGDVFKPSETNYLKKWKKVLKYFNEEE